jgi:hypothetical protein
MSAPASSSSSRIGREPWPAASTTIVLVLGVGVGTEAEEQADPIGIRPIDRAKEGLRLLVSGQRMARHSGKRKADLVDLRRRLKQLPQRRRFLAEALEGAGQAASSARRQEVEVDATGSGKLTVCRPRAGHALAAELHEAPGDTPLGLGPVLADDLGVRTEPAELSVREARHDGCPCFRFVGDNFHDDTQDLIGDGRGGLLTQIAKELPCLQHFVGPGVGLVRDLAQTALRRLHVAVHGL